ncbi:MAG: LuxR C-terminal-related transcriptional regulator, partial [Chloroflexaceae bacterium]
VLEVETLAAVLHAHCGELESAHTALQRALVLATPEGFVRPFVSRGPAMGALCQAAMPRGGSPAQSRFLQQLLEIFAVASPGYLLTRSPSHDLIEVLTPREREIIPLLATGLSHRAIAAQLQIAPDTARTHIKNIYGKLQVQNRVQAVERARALALV